MPGDALPKPSDLLIRESGDLVILEGDAGDGVFNADGTVNMVLIRPCHGRGHGNRIYEAATLERDAGNFKGWPMFDNHDSVVARKARQGLPRPPSELTGVVRESTWDPAYTTPEDAKLGFGPGAVIGRCALTDAMDALVRKIPEAIKGSLNAQATSMTMGARGGKRGWIVEGFVNDPENSSFDLVTKAGAGGRVASVLEALYDDPNASQGLDLLEAVSDDDLSEWLREHRPAILSEGDNVPDMTLQEALETPEVKGFIDTKVQESVTAALPAALAEREAQMRQEIRDELAGAARLTALHSQAMALIEAAPLPELAKTALREDYSLEHEDDDTVKPGRSLAVVEAEIDDDGKVVKSAKQVLEASIEAEVKRTRNLLREAAPTIPYAPGTGEGNAPVPTFGGEGSAWAARLAARGLDPAQFGAPKPATPAAAAS